MKSWILPSRHKDKEAIKCFDLRVVDSSERVLSILLTSGVIKSGKVLYFITLCTSNEDLQGALVTCLNTKVSRCVSVFALSTSPSRSEPIRSWYTRSLYVVESLNSWQFGVLCSEAVLSHLSSSALSSAVPRSLIPLRCSTLFR